MAARKSVTILKEILYVPGCSFAYFDGVSERAAQSDPGHSRSSRSLCRTYNNSSSLTLRDQSGPAER